MLFIPQKVIEGQAIIDFVVEHLVHESSKLYEEIPHEMAEVNMTSKEPILLLLFDLLLEEPLAEWG